MVYSYTCAAAALSQHACRIWDFSLVSGNFEFDFTTLKFAGLKKSKLSFKISIFIYSIIVSLVVFERLMSS